MKRQDQVAQSRRHIEEGLIQAVKHLGYSGLSNAQIVKAAGVSRMTFYRHFQNKREVLISLLERLSLGINTSENTKSMNTKSGEKKPITSTIGLADLLRRRFLVLVENPDLQILLADPQAREIFRDFRWQRSAVWFPSSEEGDGSYRRAFFLGGIDAITMRWLETGMIEPVEVMVKLCLEFVLGSLGINTVSTQDLH